MKIFESSIFSLKKKISISNFFPYSQYCIEKKFCHRLDVLYTFSSNTIKLIHPLKFMININLAGKVTRDPFSPTRFSSIFLPAYAINAILSHRNSSLQEDLLFRCLSDSLSRCQCYLWLSEYVLFRKSILMLLANISNWQPSSFLGTVFLTVVINILTILIFTWIANRVNYYRFNIRELNLINVIKYIVSIMILR